MFDSRCVRERSFTLNYTKYFEIHDSETYVMTQGPTHAIHDTLLAKEIRSARGSYLVLRELI